MFAKIGAFFAKLFKFFKGLIANSVDLFKRDLKEKRSNLKNANLATTGAILVDEGKSFFASAAKSWVGHALRSKGSAKIAACLDACVMPYDGCFDPEEKSVSLLRSLSTCSHQVTGYILGGWREPIEDRVSFQINIGQLYSLFV